ncbi:MAG: cadherin-like beta sandwich domain-containing protein [Bacilli bacterium]|nr:cadherin-like beta sandwich domain-containing protein [Bacilli bacterium]
MKKGFLNILAIISFLVAFLLVPKVAFAASIKVERSADTIKPGQDVTVYVKAGDIGTDSIQDYNLTLNYDSSKLSVKSVDGSGLSTVNSSNPISIIKNSGSGPISSDATIATIVLTAKSPGDSALSLGQNCKTISDKTCDLKSSTVKVAPFSSDASLSSLKIPNATISPKFDKNVTEYSSTIQDITEITVNAIASDSNAKIMISENYKNLQKGDNDIKITVTAEDGKTTKTYMIKVTLKLTPTDEELLKASAFLTNLKVKGFNLDFAKELKKYTLTVPYKITKLKITAEPENPNAKVEIDGNNKFKVGRNPVKINITSEDEQNKETYTLNVIRSKQEKKIVQTCPDTTSKREWIMFTISALLTFTLGIVLGYYLSKKEVLQKIFKKVKKDKKVEEELSNTIEIPDLKKSKNKKNK